MKHRAIFEKLIACRQFAMALDRQIEELLRFANDIDGPNDAPKFDNDGAITRVIQIRVSCAELIRRAEELLRLIRPLTEIRFEDDLPFGTDIDEWVKICDELRDANDAAKDLQSAVHFDIRLRNTQKTVEGHGLALGVDPLAWARKTNYVLMPREDRLFDLAWEFEAHSRFGMRVPPQRLVSVEREMMCLVRKIFDTPLDAEFHGPHDVVRFTRALFKEEDLFAAGFPDQAIPKEPKPGLQTLLIHYLTSPRLLRQARQIEWVKTEFEGEAIAELQAAVRRKFAESGITIETNPVSNLLVGDLGDLTSHPLWRLSPPLAELESGPPLAVCVGSDDPLPFVTNLPEEYQFLYDALILAGRSHAEARAWLDRARLAGLEARFTLSRTKTP